jgi:ectoine hydroxylase
MFGCPVDVASGAGASLLDLDARRSTLDARRNTAPGGRICWSSRSQEAIVVLRVQPPATSDRELRRFVFEHDGFVRVDNALGPEEVARYRRAVADVYERRGRPWEPLHLLAFIGASPSFVDLLDHPSVIGFVAEILGENIYCYHCHLDVHPGGEGPSQTWMWHQDGGVINRDLETEPRPRISVKVAWFLTDVSEPGRGNLMVLPGSQRASRIDRPPDDDNAIPGAEPVLARAGDAVVFDRRLWHMRSPNTSPFTREVLFLAYTFRWVRPRDDMAVPAEIRARLSSVQRQLLGDADAEFDRWMPDLRPPPLRAHLDDRNA